MAGLLEAEHHLVLVEPVAEFRRRFDVLFLVGIALDRLQAARLVELNGSHVRISRPLLDDLRRLGASVHSSPALPSGASPAATPKGRPDGMPKGFPDGVPKGFPDGIPSYGNVHLPGWVSAELDAILKLLQATSGQ